MKKKPLVETGNRDSNTSTLPPSEFFPNLYVYKDDQQLGPYSVEHIQILLQEGILAPRDLVWVKDCGSYMPIEEVSRLIVGSGGVSRKAVRHES